MFLIDYGTPVLFKSLFLKLFIKALLSRLLDTSAIEIHYYYYYNKSITEKYLHFLFPISASR